MAYYDFLELGAPRPTLATVYGACASCGLGVTMIVDRLPDGSIPDLGPSGLYCLTCSEPLALMETIAALGRGVKSPWTRSSICAGGQGRSAEDVEDTGSVLVWSTLILLAAAASWGLCSLVSLALR